MANRCLSSRRQCPCVNGTRHNASSPLTIPNGNQKRLQNQTKNDQKTAKKRGKRKKEEGRNGLFCNLVSDWNNHSIHDTKDSRHARRINSRRCRHHHDHHSGFHIVGTRRMQAIARDSKQSPPSPTTSPASVPQERTRDVTTMLREERDSGRRHRAPLRAEWRSNPRSLGSRSKTEGPHSECDYHRCQQSLYH